MIFGQCLHADMKNQKGQWPRHVYVLMQKMNQKWKIPADDLGDDHFLKNPIQILGTCKGMDTS